MSLTKSDLIDSIYNHCGFSRTRSVQLLESTLEIIKSSLESGESVLISGFGKFVVKDKRTRRGRNPQTGDDLMLGARRVVKFKCSGVLRKKMNEKNVVNQDSLLNSRQRVSMEVIMTDDKWKDFQSTISEHKKQGEVLDETIEIKRGNIQKEAENLRLLQGCRIKRYYVLRMYEDVPEDKINQMGDDEYSSFVSTLSSGIVSGGAVYFVRDESQESADLYEQHSSTLASLDIVAGSGSMSVNVLSLSEPELFPNGVKITQDYEIEDEIYKHIDLVEKELGTLFPDVKADFDYFVTKFHAFQRDKSQYQDLIGGRSMFFWNLIFGFSKQHFNVEKPRRETINKFVFGSATPISSARPLLDACFNVYSEMSGQDPSSGMSVKLGNVTVPYIEGLFRRLVGSIATILRLRKQHFQP